MRITSSIAVLGALALGACVAAPPSGPSAMALPGRDKPFEQFQQDDVTCRQYASAQTGGTTPADAAAQSQVGSAVVGTAVGAAAGAAIGAAAGNPALGAAAGAGAGLLGGTAIGANNAAVSSAELQHRYDVAYMQCMYGHGNSVPTTASAPSYPYGYPYGYPYPAYYPYPYYGYPGYVGVGVGFGRHHW